MLKAEVEATVRSLELGKSPAVDNVASDVVKNEDEGVVKAQTALCQRIWEQKSGQRSGHNHW